MIWWKNMMSRVPRKKFWANTYILSRNKSKSKNKQMGPNET